MNQDLKHLALIMDGNGRWARRRGRARGFGHRAGIQALQNAVQWVLDQRIPYLTVYAFSTDNWKRPRSEVDLLMNLMQEYLDHEVHRCVEQGVRLNVIGRRDRLKPATRNAVLRAEQATCEQRRLLFRLAVDYGARDVLQRAVEIYNREPTPSLARALERASHSVAGVPDVDLLIRSGGEQRVSDFLLWEIAYAELWFTAVCWPDVGNETLQEAMDWYALRQRRFGGLPQELMSAQVLVDAR